MKLKRTLFTFIALIFAVCVSCAFLAGCADNETNKDDVSNVDDNVSDTDFDYTLVTGDEIFNEGITLEELKEYFADVTSVSMYSTIKGMDVPDDYYSYSVYNDNEYICYEAGKELNWTITSASFLLNDYRYDWYYAGYSDREDTVLKIEKSFAIYDSYMSIEAEDILFFLSEYLLMQGNSGLELNDKYCDIDEDYLNQEKYIISTYLNLKGNLLELGYTVEGKPGTESEGMILVKADSKVYGINSTEIEIPDVDLSAATWSDRVEYNGIRYCKDTDSDGNEYYYVDYYNSSSSAEPETTINTLPVKPREN